MKYAVVVPEGVDNEAAYIRGAHARIAANAAKTARKKWVAKHADAERLEQFLYCVGEFKNKPEITANMYRGDFGGVMISIRDALMDRGTLSDKQTEIVRKSLAKREQWAAERAEQKAKEDAASGHIGAVDERRSFDLTVTFIASFDGRFGTTYIHGFKDEAGNIVIHKGSPIWVEVEVDTRDRKLEKGDKVRLTATIKEHGEREGVKQTIITRPSKAEYIS